MARRRRSLVVVVDQPDGGEQGQDGEQFDHVEEEGGAGGHVRPDDESDDLAAAVNATRRASCDRSRMSPVVFRHKNVAPCSADQDQGDAGEQGGADRSQNEAGEALAELIGSPCSSPGQPPDQQRGQHAPRGQQHVPDTAPAGRVALAAVLNATRTIRRSAAGPARGCRPRTSSRTSRGTREHAYPRPRSARPRCRPTAADLLIAARRPARPGYQGVQHADAEVEPSRMKNPVHKTAMTMYQNGMRPITTSNTDGRPARPRRPCAGGELLAGIPQHQQQVDGGEGAVQHDEGDQAGSTAWWC